MMVSMRLVEAHVLITSRNRSDVASSCKLLVRFWSSPNPDPLIDVGTSYTIWSPRLAVGIGEWALVCYCNDNCDQGEC